MSSPRWLSSDEQRAWRALIESSKVLFDALDRELQRDADIPHTYFEVLVRLSEAPDRSMRMSELADVTLSSRSRLSHAIARLEERGWVERRDCETDRRGQIATLTTLGLTVLSAAAPAHVEAVRRYVIDVLSPAQLATLSEIGETILTAIGSNPAPSS